ncbi:uncharacterized protein LOC133178796 [Saccostrea echinata]|uniref:uncharacterized protein LOC133178796 n=1 Tax=Saccostrea echinata TaxID=191078 RepID=UPI002A805F06|nr:uncharacterized protein LOC133178796 [Saccostrea echinata]
MEASNRKNCSDIKSTCIGRLEYHCVINPWGNLTVEVCAPATNISRGSCTEYNEGGGRIQENYIKICETCRKKYLSTDSYKYQECYQKQNTEDNNLPYPLENGELFHNATKFVEKSRNRSQLFHVPSTNTGFKANIFGVIHLLMIQMLLIVLL